MKYVVLFRIRLAAILLLVTLIPATEPASRAAELAKKYSIGDRVVQRSRAFKLHVGDRRTERSVPFDIWSVEKVDGPNIWVSASVGIAGWTRADQVVSIDQAMAFFSEQIRDHPRDAFARVSRAVLWLDKNELDKALTDCNEAAQIDPRYGVAYESRASVWLAKNELDKGICDVELALRLDCESVTAYVLRGRIFAQKLAYDKAMADFEQAMRIDPRQERVPCRSWPLLV